MGTHEYGAMALTALMSDNKHSFSLHHGKFSTHIALAPYSLMLRRTQEGSGILMGAQEGFWVIKNESECSSSWFSNLQKMLIFKMTSF